MKISSRQIYRFLVIVFLLMCSLIPRTSGAQVEQRAIITMPARGSVVENRQDFKVSVQIDNFESLGYYWVAIASVSVDRKPWDRLLTLYRELQTVEEARQKEEKRRRVEEETRRREEERRRVEEARRREEERRKAERGPSKREELSKLISAWQVDLFWPKFFVARSPYEGRVFDGGMNPLHGLEPQPMILLLLKVDDTLQNYFREWFRQGSAGKGYPGILGSRLGKDMILARAEIFFP